MMYLKTATQIVKKIQDAGYTCYFAGGWVRDYLMKHPSDDIDIVTDAPIDFIQASFSKTIPVGISFGIVIVVEDGHQFEIATFRKEDEYTDGRRPDKVEKASPKEDALRRDFTINGLFYDPITEEIFDYVDGQADIHRKIIRAIGDPYKRFNEDRLRMIRAVRYSARFHFSIEENTLSAIKKHSCALFPSVAIERVVNELEKMAKFPNFDQSILHLHSLNLLGEIFPHLKNIEIEKLKEQVQYLENFPTNTPLCLKLMELFPSFSLDERIVLCEYLKLSNAEKNLVVFQISCDTILRKQVEEVEKYDLAHLYAHRDFTLCFSIFLCKCPLVVKEEIDEMHQHMSQRLKRFVEMIRRNEKIITAKDLIEKGIKPGPKLGELLEKANRFAINQEIENKELILSSVL